jgi:aconitate decarboxylase
MPSAAPSDPTSALIQHVVASRYERLAREEVAAAKRFILDSLGVALSGTRVPLMPTVHQLVTTWGQGHAARVWGTGEWLPAQSAAFVNGYQIHNQEWDCLHEPAVVHPMAVVLATLVAFAESAPPTNRVSGASLIAGCCVAVDVAAAIGTSAKNALRFFRPAMCGALGATAGISAMLRFNAEQTRSALGSCYSQLSGTMQAHREGSPVLPLQIGFNARAALAAVELARLSVQGPTDFLEGAFGYFTLIDPQWDRDEFSRRLTAPQMPLLSHKPFPSGRATHGGVDGVMSLQREHGFAVHDVRAVRVIAPPLVLQLVDRPPSLEMAPSYARLCLPYAVATALLTGTLDVHAFEPAALRDPARLALAQRVSVVRDENSSLSALAPQRLEIDLASNTRLAIDLEAVLGAPDKPLSDEQAQQKFRQAAASALRPIERTQAESIQRCVATLETLPDVAELVDLLQLPTESK